MLVDGKPKTFNIPAGLTDKVRKKTDMRRRFEDAAAMVCSINLKRFLRNKEGR